VSYFIRSLQDDVVTVSVKVWFTSDLENSDCALRFAGLTLFCKMKLK
jgi:hypothetical protein